MGNGEIWTVIKMGNRVDTRWNEILLNGTDRVSLLYTLCAFKRGYVVRKARNRPAGFRL